MVFFVVVLSILLVFVLFIFIVTHKQNFRNMVINQKSPILIVLMIHFTKENRVSYFFSQFK